MVIKNVLDMIGNTPLVDLSPTMGCQIYAKAEFLNLGGSIKDRVAKNMIEAAEKEGKLKKGMTIVEPTSGNTGIGLALCGVRMGYKVIIVMPENMSEERKKIIRALGAEQPRQSGQEQHPHKDGPAGTQQKGHRVSSQLGDGHSRFPSPCLLVHYLCN